METLNNAIAGNPTTGFWEVDMKKAVKLFDEKCFISRWHDKYTLVRTTYNGKVVALKAQISICDATALIEALNLVRVESVTFVRGSTYYLPEVVK